VKLCARTISSVNALQLRLLRIKAGAFWLFDDVKRTRVNRQQRDYTACPTNVFACDRSHSRIECVRDARQRRLHPQAFDFVLRHGMI
jgi:hypothetical protein